jgi:hypothetical protein
MTRLPRFSRWWWVPDCQREVNSVGLVPRVPCVALFLQSGTLLFSLHSRFLYPFFSLPLLPPKRLLVFSNGAMDGFLFRSQGRLEAGGGGLPPPQRRPESTRVDCSR